MPKSTTALTRALEASIEAVDRRKFLGGSDIPAVLGVSPWKTAYELYLEKTGQHVQPIDEDKRKLFRRGHLLEPVIREMAREEYGLEIVGANQRHQDPEYPFLCCEVDYEWQDTDGVQNAEVKTVNLAQVSQWGEEGTDEIPVYYTAQILYGLMVTRRQRTICTALLGNDLRLYRINRDEEMIAYIREAALKFWEMVEKRTPPPITNLHDVKLAWPRERGLAVAASPGLVDLVHKYKLIGKSIAGDEAKREYIEMELRAFMGDAAELVDSDGKKLASCKTVERKGYTVEPTSYRMFRT